MIKILLSVLLCATMVGCADSLVRKQAQSAKRMEALIQRNGSLTLYSIDPAPHKATAEEEFHGYKIIGRKQVTDPSDRKRLLQAMVDSIRESPNAIAMCFNPRHGLRFKSDDEQIDLLICFQCLSADVYGTGHDKILISDTGRMTFDSVLDKYGIKRSKN